MQKYDTNITDSVITYQSRYTYSIETIIWIAFFTSLPAFNNLQLYKSQIDNTEKKNHQNK